MARGIQAAVWVFAILLSLQLLANVGFLALADTQYASPGDSQNRVVDRLEDSEGSAASGQGVVESFTKGGLDQIQIFWILITDTSEVVMVFIPFQPIADTIELLARLAMGLTFALFMRGVVF